MNSLPLELENISSCRSCGGTNLSPILDLGVTTLADRLLTKGQLEQPEICAPLNLVFCDNCSLCQIKETVSPKVLFCEDYPYFSSISDSLLKHFKNSALDIIKKRELDSSSFVIEAASNDGYMLKNFQEHDIPVLGIDPAEGPTQVAIDSGIPTINNFFTKDLATKLKGEGKQCDVFLANNVLAHVPDLNGFVDGIKIILKEGGLAVIEIPYVVDLIEKLEFDTIYHQHLCYFSVTSLSKLFKRHELYLNDVERVPIHGGSLRIFIETFPKRRERILDLLVLEKSLGIDSLDYYQQFGSSVKKLRKELIDLLSDLKSQKKKIVGYGAAAKSNTLMQYCNIGTDILDYVVDKNKFKQGRYMGGNKLQILPTNTLRDDPPDFVVILAWNFADEIIREQSEFKGLGGKFIIPIPTPKIV